MLYYAFLMTFLVGVFVGSTGSVAIALRLSERAKARTRAAAQKSFEEAVKTAPGMKSMLIPKENPFVD